ncbi:MAG: McrB family protein [Flavobacterium sp.]
MRIDITSFFFNTTIPEATATAAWGTSAGQSKNNGYKIKTETFGLVELLIGMNYKVCADIDNLDISKMSKNRELLYFSIFDKVFINGNKATNSFILLFVKEHSETHNGRLIISYPPYVSYDNKSVDNNKTIQEFENILKINGGSWFVYDISVKNQDELHFSAIVVDAKKAMTYRTSKERGEIWKDLIDENEPEQKKSNPTYNSIGESHQLIFFGSPGTGKSREVEIRIDGHKRTRITFHPETDYHSFVGSYKPVMNGSNIEYKFVPQAFTKAYCEALKNPNEPHFLIIEEINRGNCAQIFGDIFQCLDRDETGKSNYEVDCNEDLANYLKEFFAGTDIVTDKIILPNNLYILATMNTSDQSLFPMDSAFKRRWDWEFVPINYEDANSLNIVIGDSTYNWGNFIEIINPKIKELTGSEDKQLGNRFVNPNDGNITFDQFRSKVLFYLWSEVYKDEYGTQNSIFKFEENGEPKDFQFGDLYNVNSTDLVKAFLTYNAIEAV